MVNWRCPKVRIITHEVPVVILDDCEPLMKVLRRARLSLLGKSGRICDRHRSRIGDRGHRAILMSWKRCTRLLAVPMASSGWRVA